MQSRYQSALGKQFVLAGADRVTHRALNPWYRRSKLLLVCLGSALVTGAVGVLFTAWLVISTYMIILPTALPGGSHGPMDAYRHTLASAQMAFTVGPWSIRWINVLLERHPDLKRSDAMDRHNNLVGAAIGAKAGSLRDLREEVRRRVEAGAINAVDPAQVIWLPVRYWRDGLL